MSSVQVGDVSMGSLKMLHQLMYLGANSMTAEMMYGQILSAVNSTHIKCLAFSVGMYNDQSFACVVKKDLSIKQLFGYWIYTLNKVICRISDYIIDDTDKSVKDGVGHVHFMEIIHNGFEN